MTTPARVVLYGEDSEDDAFLMRRAFSEARFPGSLVVVGDGWDVTRYLSGDGRYADRGANPLPHLVLLDLKMPHFTGLEALAWIRARAELDATPVIMLSSPGLEIDIASAYANGADAYVVKPGGLHALGALVKDLVPVCAEAHGTPAFASVQSAVPPPEAIRQKRKRVGRHDDQAVFDAHRNRFGIV